MPLAMCAHGKSVPFDSFRQTNIVHLALGRSSREHLKKEGLLEYVVGGGRKNTLFNINTTLNRTTTTNNNNNNNNNRI
jgi:hypothetical protein